MGVLRSICHTGLLSQCVVVQVGSQIRDRCHRGSCPDPRLCPNLVTMALCNGQGPLRLELEIQISAPLGRGIDRALML